MIPAAKAAQVPKLRFPGFEGEWKDVAMGELLCFKNGYNAEKEQYGTGVKFINVLDIIQNDYITHDRIIGCVTIPEKDFVKNEVRYGDLLFQRSSETREEVGQSNVYLDKDKLVTFGGFVIRGRPLKEFDSVFFHALLKTAKVRKDMTSRSGGATRYNIGQDSLEEVTVNLSPTLPEQQKIAAFLTAVDGRIEQLSRKKALLEATKQGVMQQLFTQTLRFQDDHGHDFPDWEEKTLGDIAEILNGYSFKSDDFSKGRSNKVIRMSDLKTGRISLDNHATVEDATVQGLERFLLKEGDFLFGMSGSLSNYAWVTNADLPAYLNQRVGCLRRRDNNVALFIHYLYLSKYAQDSIAANAVGAAQLNISSVFLRDMRLPIPTPPEQTKIARFLSALDQKIAAVGEQMSQTQAWKKGLLQQMFV